MLGELIQGCFKFDINVNKASLYQFFFFLNHAVTLNSRNAFFHLTVSQGYKDFIDSFLVFVIRAASLLAVISRPIFSLAIYIPGALLSRFENFHTRYTIRP